METNKPEHGGILAGLFAGLKPAKRITVSQWADENRMLSSVSSAEPGQWRTSRVPYLGEIMDCLSDLSNLQNIIVMKGAQLGLTEAGNNWLGYIIDIVPAPTMMVMPTTDTIKRNSKIRIAPMLEVTPSLKEKVKPSRSRDGTNTTLMKEYPGGVLVLAGANSAAGLRSMPVRFLFLDEIDGYPLDVDGEGSPIELAEARTRSFSRKKVFKISTPTVEGSSAIESEFETTDKKYYFVPCPHCKESQHLIWEQMRWTAGKPQTAAYECIHCGEHIQHKHKTWMLANGQWTATEPQNASPKRTGFHINSLYSPDGWFSWADAVEMWEKANGDSLKEKAFINTVLGLTYKEKSEKVEWEVLYNKRQRYDMNKPPAAVCFLTAGVDVQKDRIELEIVGWCKNKESYSVDYRVLIGQTNETKVWDQLASVVTEIWQREDGIELPLGLMAIDTGYNTKYVYDFCARFPTNRVMPVKGQDNQKIMVASPKAVQVTAKGKPIGRVQIWNVGVSVIKSEIMGYLQLNINEDGEVPQGYCHFPEYAASFFKGITAERLEYTIHRGFRKYYWKKHYERNEPIDCRVYARAAASVLGYDRMTDEQMDNFAVRQHRTAPALIEKDTTGDVATVVPTKKKRERRKGGFW